MFILQADNNKLVMIRREPLTSGSVNAYTVRFEFSPDWEGLTRTAVFKADGDPVSVLLDDTGQCVIPWEVLTSHGRQLTAGVYGTRGGEVVLPTVWASLGTILEGVPAPTGDMPPTPELWEQALAQKGDNLNYTEAGELGLYAGDKLLSAVAVIGGGEGGVTTVPGPEGPPGPAGEDGATFTPSVSQDGVLRWTNDKGLSNPDPVDIRGPAGPPGADGKDGSDGLPGPAGADGKDGAPGADGKSAYEIAVNNGFEGTEAEWLASLKGEQGEPGPPGEPGSGGGDTIPAGGIIMWSGAADVVPDGWALCNGTNGTPDLRDKFVLGAGPNHPVGDTGGEEEVTLTVDQMPTHTHQCNNNFYDAATRVTFRAGDGSSYNTISGTAVPNILPSGGSQPHNNMPPYYTLAFIMKL